MALKDSAAKARKKSKTNNVKRPMQGSTRISMGDFDKPFFILVITLLVIGIVMMFSASYYRGLHDYKDGFYYAKKQIIISGVGIVIMLLVSLIDYHKLAIRKITYAIFLGSLVLLAFTSFFGIERNNARRWLKIGIEFQPSEIMKFAVIVLFAFLISKNYKYMKKFKLGILPFGMVLAVIAGLLMIQPHLSATVLICAIGFVMMFVGGARFKHILASALVGIAGLTGVVIYKIMQEGFTYFNSRILSWTDPFADPSGKTWQTCQSLIAIGSGGLFGMGFGESRQKFLYLPETQNDFVFAIVCEELGLIGALLVIILFILFTLRGFYIASKSPDKFGMMLAVGLTVQISIQAFFNIAVVTNTIPNTGISLPFFSYGGTAIAMQLAQMGVLLNISRQAQVEY